MTLMEQLLWGAIFLCLCLVLEIGILVFCADALRRFARKFGRLKSPVQRIGFLLVAIGFILFAHTTQVWIWSGAFVWSGALEDWNTAVYFSLVTYTTLGYGDIVLGQGLRIFAALASVTGLLGFGISTAFLVSSMGSFFQISKDVEHQV